MPRNYVSMTRQVELLRIEERREHHLGEEVLGGLEKPRVLVVHS